MMREPQTTVCQSQPSARIVVTGAAGHVGQNLILRLKAQGFADIVAIDKDPVNCARLRDLHPDVNLIETDLARDDGWQSALVGADALIIGHAQLGGADPKIFVSNTIRATEHLVAAAKSAEIPYMIHINSSAVNSAAQTFYAESKKAQEKIALASDIPCAVLQPIRDVRVVRS